jgi:hypothetical protein
MEQTEWNPREWCNDSEEWLGSTTNKQLFWDQPHNKLSAFIDGKLMLPGAVAFNLNQIAKWFSLQVVANHIVDPAKALSYLCQAQRYQTEATKIFATLNKLDRKPNKQGKLDLNDACICLARLVALGWLENAETIGAELTCGVNNGLFYGLGQTSLGPFILGLYAQWKNVAISAEGVTMRHADIYDKVIHCVKLPGMSELTGALMDACDFHIARSRSYTDEESFEFDQYINRIYPAEILMVLEIRRILGLPVPELKHPLMSLPMLSLRNGQPFLGDVLLERVVAIMQK